MPAFIKAEGCLVNARDVQEIHYSGNWGGLVGVKTAVPNGTDVGAVIARLVPTDKLDGRDSSGQTLDADAATAARVAESLAVCIMSYDNAPEYFLISFNADKQGWWEVSSKH